MSIRIITDSASDILPEDAAALGIINMPLTVTFGNTAYRDSVDLSHRKFYEKLIESDTLPTTSQISPGQFSEVFEKVVSEGDIALVITLSSALSGTYQSACIAAEDYPNQVFVLDSLNVCVGQRILVLRALELIRQVVDIPSNDNRQIVECKKIVNQLMQERNSVRVLAVLDTLEYLKKGGRISAATALAGGLLGIKPVVAVKDGAVAMVGKARGSKNGSNLLRKLVAEGNGIDFSRPYCVAYSGLSDHILAKYVEDSADLWQTGDRELPVATVGCVIGTHVGPNCIAVSFFEKD